MRRLITVSMLFLLTGTLPVYLAAQEPDTTQLAAEIENPHKPLQAKPKGQPKVFYGGNVSATIGNYTMIGIYPLVGYNLTPRFSAGVKFLYQYFSDKRYTETYTSSNYGGSLFARFRVIPQIYLHAEYAQMSYDLYNALGESNRTSVPFMFVGAGYRQNLGGAVWMNAQVLFDVLQDNNSPYSNWYPFVSIGFGVGL